MLRDEQQQAVEQDIAMEQRMKKAERSSNARERRRREIVQESSAVSERMRLRNGMFHEITPLCVGDPFVDPVVVSRQFARGKPNFKAGGASSQDGCFSKLVTSACSLGGARASSAPRQRPRADLPPFRVGGTRRDEDAVYALISGDRNLTKDELRQQLQRAKAEQQERDRERIQRIQRREVKRNIVTNPLKKGTFGYPGLLLQELYLVRHDDKPAPETTRHPGRGKRGAHEERPAFCAVACSKGVFASDQEVYRAVRGERGSRKEHEREQQQQQRRRRRRREQEGQDKPPFRPASANLRQSAYENYPTFLPTTRPESARLRRTQSERALMHRKESWRPSSASQTRPVRSVMLHKPEMLRAVRLESRNR